MSKLFELADKLEQVEYQCQSICGAMRVAASYSQEQTGGDPEYNDMLHIINVLHEAADRLREDVNEAQDICHELWRSEVTATADEDDEPDYKPAA